MASDSIGEGKDFVIDIPLALEPAQWPECCIYRVPKKLRKVNEKAYTPKVVSIGPFHHHITELRDGMKMHKLRYLRDFCYRTEKSQEELARIIEDDEVKIRHCYSEDGGLNSKDFVQMILLDATFIIELFLRKKNDKNDYIVNKPWLENGIRHDLILLENQLPFFVLQELYKFYLSSHDDQNEKVPFLELSLNYFSGYYFSSYGMQQPEFNIEELKHFPHLIRDLYCSPDLKQCGAGPNVRYCATKLDDAGLKFKAVDHRRLLEIKLPENRCLKHFPCFDFSCVLVCLPCLEYFTCLGRMQRILEVPTFKIDENTEALFRNLMALEECHYPHDAYICSYVFLLNCLIKTEKDVDLLVHKNIIVNQIGSNGAVATLIHKLGNQIVQTGSCYYDLGRELNEHYNHPWNRILSTLTTVYFHDFWRGTATLVGIVALGFTFWGFFR